MDTSVPILEDVWSHLTVIPGLSCGMAGTAKPHGPGTARMAGWRVRVIALLLVFLWTGLRGAAI